MKNFIELPTKSGNVLINISHIILVKPLILTSKAEDGEPDKEKHFTEIIMSPIDTTIIHGDVHKNYPSYKQATTELLTVVSDLPYHQILPLIEGAAL